MDWFWVIFWGVVLLSVLVVIHEAGHFFVARAFGVRVTEFMIGMPGPSIGFSRGGTRFGLTAIPLGGYARICGMEAGPENPHLAEALAFVYRQGKTDDAHLAAALDLDVDEAANVLVILSEWGSITTRKGTLTDEFYLAPAKDGFSKGQAREVADAKALLDEERKGTYRALSCPKRLCILFAGSFMNLLTAIIAIVLILSLHGVYNPANIVYDVVPSSPAAVAGLQPGDVITDIGDAQISNYEELGEALASYAPGDTVTVTVERGDTSLQQELTLYANEAGSTALGIYIDTRLEHVPVGESIKESFSYIGQVCRAVAKLFNPQTMQETLEQSTSVVGIAYMGKEAAENGIINLVAIAAMISISLGIMNLLPIPPLDGGRIVIEVVQKIVRRDVSVTVSNALTIIGIALFGVLFVYLLFQDIGRFVLGG